MATAMHLCGVRTHPTFPRRHPTFPRRQLITLCNRPGSLVSGLRSRNVENPRGCRVLIVSCKKRSDDGLEWSKPLNQLTSVMNFGASSVASAERMREVVDIIRSFREERPVIVLSAMGETAAKLLLAGENVVVGSTSNVSDIEEWSFVKELHLRTADELGVDRSAVSTHLEDLMRLLKVIAQVKELTLRTKAYLVSFGECMSTRIFAAYLNKVGIKARQYDAFDIGFITTDDFTNADILEATYPAVAKRLHSDWVNDSAIPVVTGSLGKGLRSGAITTLGWGASALTATTIAKAMGLREIKVPPPQSMGSAREGDIPLRVKNPYNPKAPGTLITRAQDMIKAVLSGTVFKNTVILLYILSRAIIDQIGKHPSNLWSRKDPSWEWKGKTFEQVFPDTDQGGLVTIAPALRSLVARALRSLVTGARDMFKEVQSTEALMKLAVMLYVVSSLVLRQLRKDKSDVTVLAMRLYSTSWCIKYACLLFLIVSLSVNHSLLNSWIPLPLVISWLV